ncbi:MAG: N-acetyltransferase [Cytophagia bacterium]|jgi:ribosomal protein S18 acetylase RimI-like enzyme|nr:MAG: N-acetyltransferase [Runella sp.]TAG22518.1 MAG: N-acetyltransferase [Cytophagales bacterium]TAG41553.1 MAG: N-acetyltransferase [Cytophagia bacterium]TAG52841.1 MAG: N-acetyltransferase [Runella slithyformis]TAG75570.1 MAG: N-acetyltransferase [Runella slithyformis]
MEINHPHYHGRGVERSLFETFWKTITEQYCHILRIELYVREHNQKNVRFYESLGLVNEGRQAFKILNGTQLETPIHMAWFNPNYHSS